MAEPKPWTHRWQLQSRLHHRRTESGPRPPTIVDRLLRDRKVMIAGGFIVFLIILALGAPWIAPKDPLAQNLLEATVPPVGFADAEPGFLLGTDGLGRDVLSRVIFGTRVSLTVAFVAAGLACLIGSLLGLFAGFFGGIVDGIISWLVDVWMAFPPVLLSILLVAILGTGLHSVITAIVVIDWTRFCRVVRTEAQSAGADGLRGRGAHRRLLAPGDPVPRDLCPMSCRF